MPIFSLYLPRDARDGVAQGSEGRVQRAAVPPSMGEPDADDPAYVVMLDVGEECAGQPGLLATDLLGDGVAAVGERGGHALTIATRSGASSWMRRRAIVQ